MREEQNIIIKDGISTSEIRVLIETTNTMAKALNEEDFKAIMSIYGSVADRLLKDI